VERIGDVVGALSRHLGGGGQAYWVCPMVRENESDDLAAAEARFAELKARFGDDVVLVHGQLRPELKDAAMERFVRGKAKLLVATTVIEVGVDVPDATLMIIEQAERFGLAQLHQLRGRVGRGAEQSYCLLVSRHRDELSEEAVERLEAMVSTTDGFELAERDLEIRGEGQLVGARQSGLTDLRFTRLRADRDLLERAKELAALLGGETFLDSDVERLLGEADHVGES
jgi:ATP-dependent DNA helicase RecG